MAIRSINNKKYDDKDIPKYWEHGEQKEFLLNSLNFITIALITLTAANFKSKLIAYFLSDAT